MCHDVFDFLYINFNITFISISNPLEKEMTGMQCFLFYFYFLPKNHLEIICFLNISLVHSSG